MAAERPLYTVDAQILPRRRPAKASAPKARSRFAAALAYSWQALDGEPRSVLYLSGRQWCIRLHVHSGVPIYVPGPRSVELGCTRVQRGETHWLSQML
jgi:hypothetical protein